jgi:hypothetical protein
MEICTLHLKYHSFFRLHTILRYVALLENERSSREHGKLFLVKKTAKIHKCPEIIKRNRPGRSLINQVRNHEGGKLCTTINPRYLLGAEDNKFRKRKH